MITPNRRRGVLLNLNSETDFVAKSDDFTNFLGNTLQILAKLDKDIDFERGSTDLDGLLRDVKFDKENTLEEARKLLSAKTKEKIEFGKATIINSKLRYHSKQTHHRSSEPTCIKR